ncbi:MAG: tetratricopeptide repeat protein [Hydrogenophilaceae bacterium]|nr:tetratricopeptide repeat protein [Hydrogenophilaceae bacterium]
MALDLEEQEQLDEFKAWWRQNGKWVVAAVAAFLIVVGGVRGWQYWTAKQAGEASQLFEQAMQAVAVNDRKAVKEITGQIMENYARSAYSAPAAWLAGRLNYEAGDLKSAKAQFQFALDHARDAELEQLARLRLASVLLDEKEYDAALAQLGHDHDAAYAGLYALLKGDVLVAQGKPAEAKAAYKLAVEKLSEKSQLKQLAEIKLEGLGG